MTPWWAWPLLALINPFSALWLFAFSECLRNDGWAATIRSLQ